MILRLLALAAVIGGTTSAIAAPPPPPEADRAGEITVEGRRLDPDEAKRRTSTVLRTLAIKGASGRVARWLQPICPKVVGVSDPAARVIVDKIRLVAKEAGAKLAGASCAPNIVVAFVDKPAEVYRAYAKREKVAYTDGGKTVQARLATSTRAVRWWYDVDSRSASGKSLNVDNGVMSGSMSGEGGRPIGAGGDADAGTRMGDNIRVELLSATILVDNAQVLGVPLASLAAHLAMVSVGAMELPEKPLAVASVMNLFDEGPNTDDLSEWDRAYLAALYQSTSNDGFVQRNAIASRVAKAVEAGEDK